MDGTLCDSVPMILRSLHESLEPRLGRALSDAEIAATFGPTEEGSVTALLGALNPQAVADYNQKYERYSPSICAEPFAGMRELIALLRARGIITALVTGKSNFTCFVSLRQFGMLRMFDGIECGSPQRSRKTEALDAVLEHFALSPSEAIYVGDMPSDVVCAELVGIRAVSVLWATRSTEEELAAAKPAALCHTVAELQEYLLSHIASDKK